MLSSSTIHILEINSETPLLRTSEMWTCCFNGHFVHDQVWIALLLIAVCYSPRNGNTLLFHSAQVLVPELYKILIKWTLARLINNTVCHHYSIQQVDIIKALLASG